MLLKDICLLQSYSPCLPLLFHPFTQLKAQIPLAESYNNVKNRLFKQPNSLHILFYELYRTLH